MKFSVVVPVYNAEQYVAECIESILRQTYMDFEIILVDDGSTDDSGKICDSYAELYPDRIKVIHNENQGPLMARFCGIENAAGDILMCVDSDDCIRADSLELLNEKIEDAKCDMVLFEASRKRDFSKPYLNFSFSDDQIFTGETKKKLYEVLITSSKLNSLCLKAVRMEIAKKIPQDYSNLRMKNAEDLLFSIPMISEASKVIYIDQTLYFYRIRPGSIVHTYNPERHRSIKKVHTEMEKYIDMWEMGELHARHYAREVCGWIVCLKQWLANTDRNDDRILHELAEDDYFRRAYENMDRSVLSKQEAILGRWLYEKRFGRIRLAGVLLRAIRTVKQRIKR